MTTIEILRLDSASSLMKKSPSNNSAFTTRNNEIISSKKAEFLQEIPINIIKSPSFTNSLGQSPSNKSRLLSTSPILLNFEKKTSPDDLRSNKTTKSASSILVHPNALTSSSSSTTTTTNNKMSTNNSSSQINSSDDIDDVMNTNSVNLAGDLELKANTLRFNKYGFVQPENTTNTLGNSNHAKSQSSSNQMNGANSLQSLNTNKSMSTNGDPNFNNNNNRESEITTKDYIQNTDVENFAEHLPIEVIRSRESKWIEMLENFNEWMDRRFKKIKSRCRKGIPQSMRSRAWMHLTHAHALKTNKPFYYKNCLENVKKVDVNKYIEDIKKDLHRQFPSHEIFMRKEGRQMLFNVLKAYAVHNKEVGYCQAQGPIAALLLMHMPEEDAFWMLVRISDVYLKGYFKPGLEKVQIDGQALFILFKKENSVAFKLMKSQGIDPILFMTEWFMCIFARTLPWCTVLRVWDMFFCEGVKVLFRIGLHLMLSAFNDKQKFQRCQSQGMYETLSLLKNLPIVALEEERLVKESSLIKLGEEDLNKAYEKSAKEFQKQTDEMNKNRKQAPPVSSYKNTKNK